MSEKRIRRLEQFQDMIARIYPEYVNKDKNEKVLSINFFAVSNDILS